MCRSEVEGPVRIFRAIFATLSVAMLLGGGVAARPVAAIAAPSLQVVAFLDGKPLPISQVADYYCDDFSFPVIQCSVQASALEVRLSLVLAASDVTYVTIYDQPSYFGSFMAVSQDYSALSLIGWNDRISSFKGRNSETGTFYTDWFYGGSSWSFCCNVQQPSLNAYDNTFSSIRRT
jgi:hypothetical protein